MGFIKRKMVKVTLETALRSTESSGRKRWGFSFLFCLASCSEAVESVLCVLGPYLLSSADCCWFIGCWI